MSREAEQSIEAAAEALKAKGYLEEYIGADGQPWWRLTEKFRKLAAVVGVARARQIASEEEVRQ